MRLLNILTNLFIIYETLQTLQLLIAVMHHDSHGAYGYGNNRRGTTGRQGRLFNGSGCGTPAAHGHSDTLCEDRFGTGPAKQGDIRAV